MDKKDILIAQDLFALEIAIDKADIVLNDLRNDYFTDEEPEEAVLKRLYHAAEVRSAILCDYLTEAQEVIDNIKKNLLEGKA